MRPKPVTSGKGPVISSLRESTAGKHYGTGDRPCLFLLFAEGSRPHADGVRTALRNGSVGLVSHDPRGGEDGSQASNWLELLLDGLTFDLLGLAPGKSLAPAAARHHFGLAAASIGGTEAVGIAPGPHLRGAGNAMPVVRTLLRLAISLASQWPLVKAAVWAPAGSAMDRQLFIQSVDTWLGGGPFPALGLTGIVEGPGGTLGSEGLAFFTGQELVLDHRLCRDGVAGTRLLVRLVDALVTQPRLVEETRLVLDDGAEICLQPDETIVRVAYG